MDKNIWIPIVVIFGLTVLFFFPNPESHFLQYLATIVVFVILIILLAKKKKH